MLRAGVVSIILSLILMVMYIWVRFGKNGLGYGIGAVIALAHDAFVTLGVFSLFNWHISLGFVARFTWNSRRIHGGFAGGSWRIGILSMNG